VYRLGRPWVWVSTVYLGSQLIAAVSPPPPFLRSEDAVRYQILTSRYNPHAGLPMDLVAVPTPTGLPEATPVSFTCSPALTIRCRPF
jgi:hypothetical protein